jgi:uncharacterized protein YbcV (DUF1398 family)
VTVALQASDASGPLADARVIGDTFEQADAVGAVRAIQRREIGYTDFLGRIMKAGCASYCVFIKGRKAIYLGRGGQFYIEKFPQPKQ